MFFKFYEVDREYIKYLKENGDNKIPNINYKKHNKFFCGVVLRINNLNYFAPVSSFCKKKNTVFLIKDKDKNKKLKSISSLRFSFMFLCPIDCLNQKDFSKEDKKYQTLLRKELLYCNKNKEKILKQAHGVYKLGLNEKSRDKFNICDFKKLEEKCLEYMQLNDNI